MQFEKHMEAPAGNGEEFASKGDVQPADSPRKESTHNGTAMAGGVWEGVLLERSS